MTFPYLKGEPIVPIDIQAKSNEWIEFFAYLDSGAGYSVFHVDHATTLGIDIYKGRGIRLTVGDGAQIPAYVHKLPVRFAGKEFIAEISFSPSLGIGTNILRLTSFFDNFIVCFHHKMKNIEVRPQKKFLGSE